MKTLRKIYLFGLTLVSSTISLTAQTTATNFTANDCVGASHTLFDELDAGKIIVIAWVMPCGVCAPPSLAAYNAVQGFASSNPNTVNFYLVDDIADTPCSTLTTWGNTNSMPSAIKFSTPLIEMLDYGEAGMPKIVVIGGSNHTIAYNLNTGVTQSGVTNAINDLLETMNVEDLVNENSFKMFVSPNPVMDDFRIEFTSYDMEEIILEIINLSGEILFSKSELSSGTGAQSTYFNSDFQLAKGSYILRITHGQSIQMTNFIVQ